MNSQDTEHYVNSLCSIVGTAAVCYFYWSHLPLTRQEELRRWGRAVLDELRFQLREQRVTKAGAKQIERLYSRTISDKEHSHE